MNFRYSGIFFALFATAILSFAGIRSAAGARESNPGYVISKNSIPATDSNITESATAEKSSSMMMYESLGLAEIGLGIEAFELALKGYEKLKMAGKLDRDQLLTIADFSQPSTQKRLYIIDFNKQQLLFNTYVAHGRNSGKEQAVHYSNTMSSYKSSPGFYLTEGTYYGSNGYSLRLEGLEKGINDNADKRAIVMHGADYVSENLIKRQGFLGRSQGCPAVPVKLARPIINTIKDGSLLFIYAPVNFYAQRSTLIK